MKSHRKFLVSYICHIEEIIEMKLCMSRYRKKNLPYGKFESSSFSIFGDMTLQTFSLKKGMSHRIRLFTPGNGFKF